MSSSIWVTDEASSSHRRAPLTAGARRSRLYRHLFLWVLQTWLAMFYLGAGYTKLSQPRDMLALMMTWPGRVDVGILHVIGWVEVGLALGVVAPLLSWSLCRPILLVSATGLLIDAGFMTVFHAFERDSYLALLNGLLVVVTSTALGGRWTWRVQGRRSGSSEGR